MRKSSRHVCHLQLFAEDFLTLNETPQPRQENWEGERPLLAAESLRASGTLRLRVRGESMLPTIWPGEMVEIARCSADEAHRGDVVLALRDGRFFLHRLVERVPGGFLLRGDSMPATDPEFSSAELLGRVSGAMPHRWWSRIMGRVFCYSGIARRLALKLHEARARGRLRYMNPSDRTHISAHASLAGCTIPLKHASPELPNAGA